MIPFLGGWIVRSSLLILSGALLLRLMRVKNPAARLTAWTAMLAGSLAIPLLSAALPNVPIAVMLAPVRQSATLSAAVVGEQGNEPAAPATLDLGSAPAQPRAVTGMGFDWMRLAAILYALAAGALLLRLFVGLVMSLRVFRRSRDTGIVADGARVRESDRVASPVTIGVLRPAMLLPADWRAWQPSKLAAVLAHERSHIRRHDPAVQFLSAMHRALLWASPLSWFPHRGIVRTAEEISDDDAVAATHDRVSYAEILLEFVQRGVGQTSWLGVPMARYDRPAKRIRRILNSTSAPRGVTRWGVAAILTLGAPLTYLAAAAHPQSAPQAALVPVPISQALAPAPPEPDPVPTGAPVPAPAPAPSPKPVPAAAPVEVAEPQAPEPPATPGLKLEPIDSSIVGLTLTGPDDPAFQTLAAALVPPDQMTAAAPYFPESVIVTNNSGQALLAIGVDFTFPGPTGRPIHGSTTFVDQSLSRPVMAAGERKLIFFGGSLRAKLRAGRPPRVHEGLAVAIDLCVYADFLVAGPDSRQGLAQTLSQMRADYDVCSQVGDLSAPSASALATLEKEAAAAVEPPAPGADWYAWDFRQTAERLLEFLRSGNTVVANTICAPSRSAPAVAAALHR
jgi:beta-lactamase regulating signal transducer with metallopeptidase domain